MKQYLLLSLLILSACSSSESLCFKVKQVPKWVDTFYANRTEHQVVGEDLTILVTTCPELNAVKELKNKTNDKLSKTTNSVDKSSDCFFNGKNLNMGCPKDKYCEVDLFEGTPVPLCKPR